MNDTGQKPNYPRIGLLMWGIFLTILGGDQVASKAIYSRWWQVHGEIAVLGGITAVLIGIYALWLYSKSAFCCNGPTRILLSPCLLLVIVSVVLETNWQRLTGSGLPGMAFALLLLLSALCGFVVHAVCKSACEAPKPQLKDLSNNRMDDTGE